MAVEQIMFFALGFLVASLLAIIVMPSVWKRAVRLTKKRIEAATPITMAEFRADKDQLRAQFALDTRRLERNIETLRGRLTEQLADLNDTRTELAVAKTERDRATTIKSELEERNETASERVLQLEREVADLSQQLRGREREIADLKANRDTLIESPEKAPRRSAVSSIRAAFSLGEKDTFDALDGINEAYSRISDAGSSLDALLANNSDTVKPSLAEELSQEEAREELRKKINIVEISIDNDRLDKSELREKLNDIANSVSTLVYASDGDKEEESLFDRIRKFTGDVGGDADSAKLDEQPISKKLPALASSTTVSDRLAAFKNFHAGN